MEMQLTNLLQAGAQFTLSGSSFEVVHVKRDEVRVAPMRGGPMQHFKFKALAALAEEKRIELTYFPRNREERETECLRALTQAQRDGQQRRSRYVRGMLELAPNSPCSQASITKHLPALASRIGDTSPPGASTVAGWMKRWLKAGQDDVFLVNRTKPSRADFRKYDPQVLEYINSAIVTVYLNKNRGRKGDVKAEVLRLISNHNVDASRQLEIPSDYLINRLIQQIDLYERDLRREGKAFAKRKHRAAGKAFIASEPLEACMADGQMMDVIVIEDPSAGRPRKVLGRPFLTVIMDVRTRCILAAFISLQPFCGGTVLKAMMEAVVASPGRPRGIMSKLIVDNGCDYTDSGFRRFLCDLDVELEICSPYSPNGKAHVERFFRTLNEDLIHKISGTTFSNPEQRGEYRSQDMAHLTLKDLRARVQTWIDEVYHVRDHHGLGMRTPIDVWNEETQP